jgi:tetratricopeptide (TPR) repeat protein
MTYRSVRKMDSRVALCALSVAAGIGAVLASGCASAPPKPNITPVQTATTSVTQQPTADSDSPGTASTDTPVAKKQKPFKSAALAKSFDDAVARGDAAWLSGDVDMAIYLYVQALSFRPTDAVTLSKLGVIEQHTGNLQLAARAYELAANANPGDARLSAQLGLVYLALGQDDSARKWLARSADAASSDWRVYDGLGVIEQRRGEYASALGHLQRAQALAPNVAAPVLHRGQALFSDGNYAEAEAAARDAIRRDATPEAWELLGNIQSKRRAYADSLDSLLEVMNAPAAYNLVANAALENGDNAAALRYFERASTLSPVYLPDAERNANRARERLDSTGR